MIGWFAASPLERRLLPGGRLNGPTPWLIAIMMFVMVSVAATGIALANGSRALRAGVAHRAMIQIADGRASAATAASAARSAPGVTAVHPIPDSELRATLERWLGPVALREDGGLPLPALIDVDLAANANRALIEARIRKAAPNAQLVAHEERIGPMLGALSSLAWLAAALVSLIGLATAAAVVLATRAALHANRSTIEVMHGVGATDAQVAHLFQRRIALDALGGGAVGGLAALAVLLLLAIGGLGSIGDLFGGPLLGLSDVALLVLLPLAGAALATLVARGTILRALREQL